MDLWRVELQTLAAGRRLIQARSPLGTLRNRIGLRNMEHRRASAESVILFRHAAAAADFFRGVYPRMELHTVLALADLAPSRDPGVIGQHILAGVDLALGYAHSREACEDGGIVRHALAAPCPHQRLLTHFCCC